MPGFGLTADAEFGFADFFVFGGTLVFGILGFGSKRSLSEVTVAGVQVVVDEMLSRIEFAVAFRESMMIQNAYAVLLKIRHYPRLC